LTKEEAIIAIKAASVAAKAEGAKLANQLIDDVEAEGVVLDEQAKLKILALSIQVGIDAASKIGDVDTTLDELLDGHKTVFTAAIINFIESQGHSLTIVG